MLDNKDELKEIQQNLIGELKYQGTRDYFFATTLSDISRIINKHAQSGNSDQTGEILNYLGMPNRTKGTQYVLLKIPEKNHKASNLRRPTIFDVEGEHLFLFIPVSTDNKYSRAWNFHLWEDGFKEILFNSQPVAPNWTLEKLGENHRYPFDISTDDIETLMVGKLSHD